MQWRDGPKCFNLCVLLASSCCWNGSHSSIVRIISFFPMHMHASMIKILKFNIQNIYQIFLHVKDEIWACQISTNPFFLKPKNNFNNNNNNNSGRNWSPSKELFLLAHLELVENKIISFLPSFPQARHKSPTLTKCFFLFYFIFFF